MERIFETLFKLLPMIFALGFLAPVFNQVLLLMDLQPPFSLSTLTFSMLVASIWGSFACITGRWI